MKVPAAPSWPFVFLFGALWNLVVARSLWGAGFCIWIAIVCHFGSLLMKKMHLS